MWHLIQSQQQSLVEGAKMVLTRLQDAGNEAYLVGGCVRDTLLGKEIHDIDIATSALPAEVTSIFDKTIPTGLQHGTVTVLVDEQAYEITTFRTESAYEQYRRPTEVQFIKSLAGDLLRRDFTFNAMALAIDGQLHDPYGGARDLKARVVRCVGDADARFQEDALRMLRCIRFAAAYRFTIDDDTWQALLAHRSKLQYIAMERVHAELDKMVQAGLASMATGMQLLAVSRLLQYTKMDASDLFHTDQHERGSWWQLITLGEGTATDLSDQPKQHEQQIESTVLWALLLLRSGLNAEASDTWMKQFKFSNRQQAEIAAIVHVYAHTIELIHESALVSTGEDLRKLWILGLLRYGKQAAYRWLQVMALDAQFTHSMVDHKSERCTFVINEAQRWLNEIGVSSIGELAVNGQQLLERFSDKSAGKWLGEVLNHLFAQVAIGALENNCEILLEEAERVVKQDE